MLKLPDDEFVTVELVHDGNPVDRGTDVGHFVVQVESVADTLGVLAGHGIEPAAPGQESDDGLKTTFIADPDGSPDRARPVAHRPHRRHHRRRLARGRGLRMGRTPLRLYMSMSVDGYITGPDDRPGQELGRNGGRLFNWLDDRMSEGINGQVYAEASSTGAVISGRRTFELAGRWQGDHHDGVPIHVLTHNIDPADEPPGSAKFYTDVNACANEAREAAGDRAVLVHGAGAAQALLAAGQLDELELHLVPVLLGDGRRLFEPTGCGHIELELVRRLEGRNATHLRYRIVHREGEQP